MNFTSPVNDLPADVPRGAGPAPAMRSKPMSCSTRSRIKAPQPDAESDSSKNAARAERPAFGSSLRFALRSIKQNGC